MSAGSASPLTHGAECDGVAQRFDGRDTVLPFGARWAAQEVDRAGRKTKREALPPSPDLTAETEGAGREERDPNHLPEGALVLVPADGCPERVFGEEDVFECGWRQPGEVRGGFAQRVQERRDRLGPQ